VRDGARLMVLDAGHSDVGEAAAVRISVEPTMIPAVLNGVIAVLLAGELAQRRGAGEVLPHGGELEALLATFLPGHIGEDAGVEPGTLRAIAESLVRVRPAVVCSAFGPGDDLAGTGASVVRLQALLDDLAGVRSVTLPLGTGNAQGLAAMGVAPDVLPGGEPVTDAAVRARFAQAWGVDGLPGTPGRGTASMMDALRTGALEAVWVWADEAGAFGDEAGLLGALDTAGFAVVQAAVHNELTALADVLLPSLAWGEVEGTFTNVERRVSRVRRVRRSPELARPGWWAAAEVARRLGHDWPAPFPAVIWDEEISRLAPGLAGVTYAELEDHGLCWAPPVPVAAA